MRFGVGREAGSTARLTSEALRTGALAHHPSTTFRHFCIFMTLRLCTYYFSSSLSFTIVLLATSLLTCHHARIRANVGRVLDRRTGIFQVHPPHQSLGPFPNRRSRRPKPRAFLSHTSSTLGQLHNSMGSRPLPTRHPSHFRRPTTGRRARIA